MSKAETLRALVTERLTAAAEEIFVLFERTMAEYEEELFRCKEENQRNQQQLLECQSLRTVTEVQTQTNSLSLKRDITEIPEFKGEPEEQLPGPFPEVTVCVKIEEPSVLRGLTEPREKTEEDIGPELHLHLEPEEHTDQSSDTDNDDDWGAPLTSSAAQMETEVYGEHCSQNLSTVSVPESSAAVNSGDAPETVCKKKLRTDSLQTHLVVHAGDKPYQCSLCDGTFKYFSNLKRHMKIHTGEKPFACSVCGRPFMFMCELKLHMRTHTGEKPYRCSLCDKQYKRSNHLTRHMRSHTGERPYSCVICDHSFRHMHGLKAHMMKTHA